MLRSLAFGIFWLISISSGAQTARTYYDPLRQIASTDSYLSEAIQLIQFGDPEGAIRRIKESPPSTRRSFEAEFLLGYAYRIQGDLNEAIEYFSKATRYENLSLPAFFERGNCYLLRKNFNLAVFDYDRAILIDSAFAPAYNNRAYARIRNYGEQKTPTQQLRFARKDMEKVLALSAIDSSAGFEYFYNLGLLDLYLSDYELAIQSFNQAMQSNNRVSKLYYFRGAAYFLGRYYHKAGEDFQMAENMGFESSQTPEFLRVIELIRQHEETTGEKVGKP